MFRHPKKSDVRNPFLKPFRTNVWWLTLNVSIICWILLLISVKIEDYYNSKSDHRLYSNACSETALITFAAVSQQGIHGMRHCLYIYTRTYTHTSASALCHSFRAHKYIHALFSAGLSEGPHLYSGRIVFITLFLWALLMYQFYSASIVGSLLAAPPRFINNLIDLANSDLHVASEDIPYSHDYFKVCC